MVFVYKKLAQFAVRGVLCLPGDQSHLVCSTVNKPSCVLHLLGWFIGSRRPEFWVLHYLYANILSYKVAVLSKDKD